MCVYINSQQLFRQPPHNHWRSGGGPARRGHAASRTDGRCRQECRSPSPTPAPRGRGPACAPGWDSGATTAVTLHSPHRPAPERTRRGPPKVAPQSVFTEGSPASPRFSIPPLCAPAPCERHFCGAGRGRGSHTPPAPRTPLPPQGPQDRVWHARMAGGARQARRRA